MNMVVAVLIVGVVFAGLAVAWAKFDARDEKRRAAFADVAFTLKNLQVTAFITDPANPSSFRTLATLVPEHEIPGRGGLRAGGLESSERTSWASGSARQWPR